MMQEIYQLVQAMAEKIDAIEKHVTHTRKIIDTAAIEAAKEEPVELAIAGMPDTPAPVADPVPVVPTAPESAAPGIVVTGPVTCTACGTLRTNPHAPCPNCGFLPPKQV